MDDFVLNVRQIMEYPLKGEASSADAVLLQTGALGGPYAWTTAYGLVVGALDWPGSQLGVGLPLPGNAIDTGVLATNLLMPSGCTFGWNWYQTAVGPALLAPGPAFRACFGPFPNGRSGVGFYFSSGAGPLINDFVDVFNFDSSGYVIISNQMLVGQDPTVDFEVATKRYVDRTAEDIINNSVWSFNARRGNVSLFLSDVLGVGGAPINSPGFTGFPTAPTPLPGDVSNLIATTSFVDRAITQAIDYVLANSIVSSFNGRTGAVILLLSDILSAGGAPINSPSFTGTPTAPNPAFDSNSTRIATTSFVQSRVYYLAPLDSPFFLGVPRAPTPPFTDNSTRLATTAWGQYWNANISAFATGYTDNRVNTLNAQLRALITGIEQDLSIDIERIVRVRNEPPVPAKQGDLWWDSSKGKNGGNLFIWYDDPTGAQWVVANSGPPGPPGLRGPPGKSPHVGRTPPEDAEVGDLWYDLETWLLFAKGPVSYERWDPVSNFISINPAWAHGGQLQSPVLRWSVELARYVGSEHATFINCFVGTAFAENSPYWSPYTGATWLDTRDNSFHVYNGTRWVTIGREAEEP